MPILNDNKPRVVKPQPIELDPKGIEADKIYQKRMPTEARSGDMEKYYQDQELQKGVAQMAVDYKYKPAKEKAKEWAWNAALSLGPELAMGAPVIRGAIGSVGKLFKVNPLKNETVSSNIVGLLKKQAKPIPRYTLPDGRVIVRATSGPRPFVEELPDNIIIDMSEKNKLGRAVDKAVNKFNPREIQARRNLPPPPTEQNSLFGLDSDIDINPSAFSPIERSNKPLPTDVKISENLYLRDTGDGGKMVLNPTTGENIYTSRHPDGTFTTYGNMNNPLDAGKAISTIQKQHKIGDQFAHPGSLSPDSWKFWQTRVNRGDLKPIDTGEVIPLNTMGKHTKTSKNMSGNIFKTESEAQKIADELNMHIKDPRVPKVKMVELGWGEYSVQIPDITYEKLRLILGPLAVGGTAAKVISNERKLGGLLKCK